MLFNFFQANIWGIPDGFATLIGGFIVLIAAVVAYIGVVRQVHSQLEAEKRQVSRDRDHVRVALYSELLMYARLVIDILSLINQNHPPKGKNETIIMPLIRAPLLFNALKDKIGSLGESGAIMSTVGFYLNLQQMLDDYSFDGKSTLHLLPDKIRPRIRLMALQMAESLDHLGPSKALPIPEETPPEKQVYWDGKLFDELSVAPNSIQTVLRDLAGWEVRH